MKYFKRIILSSCLSLCLFILFNSNLVSAVEYGGLNIAPNKSEVDENNTLTKSWFFYILKPEEVKNGKVDIINNSDKSTDVNIYVADAFVTEDGVFAPESEDKEKVNIGNWTTLAESEVSLMPKETKTVDFTIKIPNNTKAGEYAGTIIIQNKKTSKTDGSTDTQIITKIGARMYVTVQENVVKELNSISSTKKTTKGNSLGIISVGVALIFLIGVLIAILIIKKKAEKIIK
ncbi:MAG: DUF916 domain-containing protein [bacterium]|nr:DUF916 domain-containing protein [bacterium]